MRRHHQLGIMFACVATAVSGCTTSKTTTRLRLAKPEPTFIEYHVEFPSDWPRILEMPEKDGTTRVEIAREWYAWFHREGWNLCLDDFLAGRVTLTGKVPPIGGGAESGWSAEARADGYHRCLAALREAAGADEAALRARLKPPTWYERIDHYVDGPTRRAREEAGAVDPLLQEPDEPTREWAFALLLRTNEFTSTGVGYAAETPVQLKALKLVTQQPDAAAALRDLLRRGQPGGQLFALCGLYFADPESYRRGVALLRNDTRPVTYFSGCILNPSTITEVVECRKPGAVRLQPGQTLDDWFDKNDSGFLDIIGGGFPHAFREKLKRMDAKGEEAEDDDDDQAADGLFGK